MAFETGLRVVVDATGARTGSTQVNQSLASIGPNARRMQQQVGGAFDGLRRTIFSLQGAMVGLGAVFAARAFVQAVDTFTLVESRLKLVTSSTSQLTGVMDDLFGIAQRTRSEFEATGELYARLARNTESLGLAQSELLGITETVNQAIQVSGATAAEASAGVVQFSQGLASGRLSGDELRSVLEQLPRLARAIADGLGVTIGELRGLGEEGELTAEKITAALLDQAPLIESEFAQVERTVSGALTQLGNDFDRLASDVDKAVGATDAFKALIDDLRAVIADPELLRFLENLGRGFGALGAVNDAILSALTGFGALSNIDLGTINRVIEAVAPIGTDVTRVRELEETRSALSDLIQDPDTPPEGRGNVARLIAGIDAEIQQLIVSAMAAQGAMADFGGASADAGTKVSTLDDDIVKLIDDLRFEVQQVEALRDAQRQGEAQVEATIISLDAERAIRKAGIDTTSEQADTIRELTKARLEGERAVDDFNTAEREAARAVEATTREMERQREQQEALLRRPFENALDGIQATFTDTFETIFSGGVRSFGDLADAIKQIFIRLAAEIATLMVFRPVVGGILGAAGLGGIGQSLGLGGGGFGSPFGLGGIGGDLLSGVTLGGLFGTTLPAGTASSLGVAAVPGGIGNAPTLVPGSLTSATLSGVLGAAGLGFAGGSLLASLTGGNQTGGSIGGGLGAGIGFALGGPIGGIVGGLGGSLLGGLFGGGSSTEFNAFTANLASGAITQGTTEIRSGAGQQNADAARQLAQSFAQQIAPAVLEAIGGSLPGGANVSFGVSSLGVQLQGLGGAPTGFGLTPDQAVAEAVQRLVGLAEGVSDDLSAAIARSTATTFESLLRDIDLASLIIGEGRGPTLQDAVEPIKAQLDELTERGLALGFSFDQVTAAVDRTRDALVDELLGGIRAFQAALGISQFAPVSPIERFNLAQQAFDDLTGRARTGDLAAIDAFPGAAQEFLTIAQGFFASGPGFVEVFQDVNRTLNQILDLGSFQHGGSVTIPGGGGPDSRIGIGRFAPGETLTVRRAGETDSLVAAVDRGSRTTARATQAVVDQLAIGFGQMVERMERLERENARLRSMLETRRSA